MSGDGLATPRTTDVWTVCLDCRAPVRLLGSAWHHEDGQRHPARPDMGEPPEVVDVPEYGHAYDLVALVRDRRAR